jgi:hypothetical protein
MLTRFGEWQGHKPESVAADTTYGNGGFLQWLADRKITPYMGTRDSIHLKNSPYYGPECFITTLRTTATSVLQGSHSTMVVATWGIGVRRTQLADADCLRCLRLKEACG